MIVALTLIALAQQGTAPAGADRPAFAPDGRLAVAARGDIWVRDTSGPWTQVTSGPSWDREPAWASNDVLVFASDRSGGSDIFLIRLAGSGAAGEPVRLTEHPDWEGEPAALPDGTVYFVRGAGGGGRIWRRTPGGAETRLTSGTMPERWPAVPLSGSWLAYVEAPEGSNRLVVRRLDRDTSWTVAADREVERPAWSADGRRLTFTTRTGTIGVWVTAREGGYTNLVSARAAASAWAPHEPRIALVDLQAAGPGYNGDPARVDDREAGDELSRAGAIWTVAAPEPPDLALAATPPPTPDQRTRNIEAFTRVWRRVADLYYRGDRERLEQWRALAERHQPAAQRAANDAALEDVLYGMLRERPTYGVPASGRAAVSSAHPVATAAGLEILRSGGNVVDAAIAVSFALGVVEPDASGIGGYGQMLIFQPGMREPVLIEFMTRAPEEASLLNAALLEGGRLPDDGPVLANVPGTVAAMHLAWRKFGSGRVSWADLVAPAIRAAEDGFVVSGGLATTLAVERDHFATHEGSRALFFRNGEPLAEGDTLHNPDLARTLRRIAEGGADAFYRGDLGRRIVADLRGHGNAIRMTDLERYYAVERPAVGTAYRGHQIYSSAPPSGGGATLAAQLNLLERFDRPANYAEHAPTLHAMIEAWKLVPSGRGRIADPGLWPVTTEPYTSKDTARVRWQCFDPDRALEPDDLQGEDLPCARELRTSLQDLPDACEGPRSASPSGACHAAGTTSFAVADAEGSLVAVTQTLGTWGGNFYVTPGLGFLYNDKLGSYASDPASYGARLPNARHGSSLAPAIVLRKNGDRVEPVLAAGAAGNEWITSAVYSVVAGVIDAGLGPQEALELPRFHVSRRQRQSETVYVVRAERSLAPAVVRRLESLGHEVEFISLMGELRMGYGAAVTVGRGRVTAGADPRRSGAAGAVP